jgi:transposase
MTQQAAFLLVKSCRKLDHQTLEDIGIRAIQALQAGMHPEDVVQAFGLGKRCIYNWLAAYRAGGYGQLKPSSCSAVR